MLSIITAISENFAIGKNNDLPWHLPKDLKYFMNTTKGHRVIMGRKTFESINCRPLPRRENIVISTSKNYDDCGATSVKTIEEAMALCPKEEESFITGGSYIYEAMLPYTDRLYLTRIHKDFEADTFFPKINFDDWKLVSREEVNDDEQADFSYAFEVWERK